MFAASKTASVSTGGYQISRSLRFNSADSAYLTRGFSSGNRKTFTWSAWIKKTTLDVNNTIYSAETNTSNQFWIAFGSANTLVVFDYQGAYNLSLTSTPLYRDVSAWYHIVVAVDTTQATSTNRAKVYVNGLEITVTGTYPTQNYDTMVNNSASTAALGRSTGDGRYLNSYMTEVNFIDGQALTPSSFGETNAQTGVWQPKAYSGSYGTNGFYLNFSDNSNTTAATLGADYSGNGNNWTPNNFSVTAGAGNDSLVDSPTSYGTDTGVGGTVRGNYATFNAVNVTGGGTSTITNGNLDTSVGSITTFGKIAATFGLSTGQWYWEVLIVNVGGGANVGISNGSLPNASYGLGGDTGEVAYQSSGNKYLSGTGSAYGSSYTTNDIIGVAYDADAGSITFYKNNTSQGAITGFTGTKYPAVGAGGGSNPQYTANFGQRPFAYTAPSGFKALCTQNLPTPTIGATSATQAGKYFNPVLYTGTGSSLGVTGVGFQPDWTWIKLRNAVADHALYDAVRGVQKQLESNNTSVETTETNGLTAFGSDGFTVGTLGQVNGSGSTYVSWNWKANGSGSTNTSGSITSTVSANTTSGFSVVTYTGTGANATVGHGLGVAPSMVITKSRSDVGGWAVYHISAGASYYLLLNGTSTAANEPTLWNNTAPTSTRFSIGTSGAANTSAATYVAYCFAPIAGYSKFGSYTGNASTDGPFVYTGFRPAFVLFKRTDATSDWWMYDTKRSPSNEIQIILWPNYSDAEATGASIAIDILSNGFKPRSSNATFNGTGGTYIFMAFAESPQKFSLAR